MLIGSGSNEGVTELRIERQNIYAGILSRMVVAREGMSLSESEFTYLDQRADGKQLYYQDIRKIAFLKGESLGYDLHSKVGGRYPAYYLYDQNLGDYVLPEHNDLFIRDFRPYCDLLMFLGISEELSSSELSKTVKILLSKSTHVMASGHEVDLSAPLLDERSYLAIGRQGDNLYQYIMRYAELPTTTQKIEKTYSKIRV